MSQSSVTIQIVPESLPRRAFNHCWTRGALGGRYSWRHVLFSPCVGVERDGVVYELFVSTLPTPAFTASDVLDLYLHRGSFETVLADEDDEQESDRWYSHTPCGKAVCSNLGPVGVEPPPGTGADALSL
jgi:hypothetical protein